MSHTSNAAHPTMQAGLWIDHRRAVIVTVTAAAHDTTHVLSHVERRVRFMGGAAGGATQGSRSPSDESTREHKFEGHLDQFYDEVIEALGAASGILVFGPGEAKGELRARLEHHGFAGRVLAVEPADKLTDPQIVARVRERLVPGAPPHGVRAAAAPPDRDRPVRSR